MKHLQPTLMRILCLIWLLLLAWGAWRTDWQHALTTDIFDLMDTPEQGQAQNPVPTLLRKHFSREILIQLQHPDQALDAALARAFIAQIRAIDRFSDAACHEFPSLPQKLVSGFFEKRLPLLLPQWIEEQKTELRLPSPETLAKQAVDKLDAFLASPEGFAYEAQIPADPLLLLPQWMEKLSANQEAGQVRPNVLHFSIRLSQTPSTAQESLLPQDLDRLRDWLSARDPAIRMHDSGFHRYANESRERIRSEVFRLNLLALGSTLLLAAIFIRRPLWLIPLFTLVAMAIASALMLSLLVFGQLHVLALVMGSILAGVAVDYGFHLILKREELAANSFARTLHAIRTPLLVSCLSTAAGFLFLMGHPVTAIRQMGVFVAIGLLAALALNTLASLGFDRTGPLKLARNLRFRLPFPVSRRLLLIPYLLALPALGIHFFLGSSRDQIEDLQIPLVDAPANEAKIRANAGNHKPARNWITTASSVQELVDLQHQLHVSTPTARLTHLANFLPCTSAIETLDAYRSGIGVDFPEKLEEALEASGYDRTLFAPFLDSLRSFWAQESDSARREASYHALLPMLTYPLNLLLQGEPGGWWGLTLARDLPEHPDWENHPAHTELKPLAALNRIFGQYREQITRTLVSCAAIITLILLFIYGPRRCLNILAIPCCAIALSLGLLTFLNPGGFSLFHWIGVLLGACISLDYAIFASEAPADSPPLSIRISAYTTTASFFVIASSSIKAVSDLGSAVGCITLLALVLIELHYQHFSTRPSHASH
jgi:predicted exporter